MVFHVLNRGMSPDLVAVTFQPGTFQPGDRRQQVTSQAASRAGTTQYRLRIGEFRVFYDVADEVILIIQILNKQDSIDYLGGSS